jgi:hypothetical protein
VRIAEKLPSSPVSGGSETAESVAGRARKSTDNIAWDSLGKDARMLARFRRILSLMKEGDRKVLFFMAQKMGKLKAMSKRISVAIPLHCCLK